MFEPIKKVLVSALVIAGVVGLMVGVMLLGELVSRIF